jgi:hypothetical protein
MTASNLPQRPAWREPMVWLMVGLPLASVIAGFMLLATAIRTSAAEVDDQVQHRAQAQVSELAPDERAAELRLAALLQVQHGRIELLAVSGALPRGQALHLNLRHPTDSAQDRLILLTPNAMGWGADVGVSGAHDWLLRLAPGNDEWRLVGRLPMGNAAARLGPALPAN